MIANYNQLTIKQFLKCKTVAGLEPDPILRKIKMMSAITGRPEDEFESMPLTELLKAVKEFSQIEALQPGGKVRMKFKVNGRRFTCIWQQQHLSAAQYIDSSFFCKDEKYLENIHNILAAICVERTWYGRKKKYNGENHKEIADLFFNHMKIATAYPLMLFFCKYWEALENNMLAYLTGVLPEIGKKISTQNGVGL